MSDDPAYTLFPTDAPPSSAQAPLRAAEAPRQGDKADAAELMFGGASARPAPAQRPGIDKDPIRNAFPTEDTPDVAASVGTTLTPWADALHAEGRQEAAAEMRAVADALAADFRQNGMTAEDTQEVMDLARESLGNMIMPGVPVGDDRLAEMRTAAESWIEENAVSQDDLDLARRLVDDLDRKTGGQVKAYLIDTGMGNRPETIAKAVEIARRRYAR